MDVAIVGAGMAGLEAARLLAERGVALDVDLFRIDQQPASERFALPAWQVRRIALARDFQPCLVVGQAAQPVALAQQQLATPQAQRRVYALVASLPYSGAQTAFFSFETTIESFLEGHARAFEWLEGVPRACVYDNLRSVVARRERDQVIWNQRFLHLRGHYGFHATACTPATPREKGSVEGAVRYLKSGFWPARRFATLGELDEQYVDWRDRTSNVRIHASGRFPVAEAARRLHRV